MSISDSNSNWKLHDAVYVEQKSASSSSPSSPPPILQGVIAFLGPVRFADGNDWAGIRLTGPSVGKGRNDGTVQGIQYFETGGANSSNGIFVKKSALKKRSLSRLEELRLKRELKAKSGTSPSVRRLKLDRSSSGGGGGTNVADDDASVSSMSSMRSSMTSATSGTNRSRLDEIRNRRLALQRNNSKVARSSPATPSASAASPGSATKTRTSTPTSSNKLKSSPTAATTSTSSSSNRKTPITSATSSRPSTPQHQLQSTSKSPTNPTKAEVENSHLKTKIEILAEKLTLSEGRTASLQADLDASGKEVHELKLQLSEFTASMEQVQRDAETKIALAVEAAKTHDDDGNGDGDGNGDDHVVEIQKLREEIENLQSRNEKLKKENEDEINRIKLKLQVQITSIQESFEQDLAQKETENTSLQTQISTQEGRISFLENKVLERDEQAALREDHDSTHYKERAKLQADILSWQRKVQDVTKEKLEMEIVLEELTLDKESLQERCEEVEDLLDEFKIDAESAQMEAEEMRIELESARERAEKAEAAIALGNASGGMVGGGSSEGGVVSGTRVDAEDVAQALSIQNARLREAIIRLREQTTFEKMELTKKLRAAEKESGAVAGLKEEVTKLLRSEKTLKGEVNELKEIVDQGSAFEQMVEEMSDRVLAVEDNNIALQSTIRSLEEAEELNAEMEEAQADEIKALMKELQNRDTVVINLEEAIKIQRRRELDFQRTVGNYRKTIDTLQQEKNSLLALHEGGEGEKNNALLASQKALAQAAQSVADAAAARKREAHATFDLIDGKVKSHLADRLESFLPQNIASSEISAVKGELLLSKIAMKASLSLNSMSDIFNKTVNEAKSTVEDVGSPQQGNIEKILITGNISQLVGTMIHQTKFTQLVIDTSSECLRLLSISQWPEVLSSSASVDFGIAMSHTIPSLDSAISEQLLKLKEEGILSPHQSNLNILDQALQNMKLSLDNVVDADDKPLIPSNWSPPSLGVFKDVSSAKFACLGTASVLASIISVEDSESLNDRCFFISKELSHIQNISAEISTVANALASVDITDIELFQSMSKIASDLKDSSSDLFTMVEMILSGKEIISSSLDELNEKAVVVRSCTGKLLTLLRASKKDDSEGIKSESLSPEISDPWEAIKALARKVKSSVGDADDVNYLIRGRNLEEQLSVAVENDAKLSIAHTKIRSLEKNLATRSKEISMQNGRLQELENMLSQTAVNPVSNRVQTVIPQQSEDSQEMKEEVRILNEAMEVLQTQVDEYEREIRTLKDPQRGKNKRGGGSASSRKSATLETDFSLSNLSAGSSQRSSHDVKSGLVEAALFRPALRSARSDASVWKSKSIVDTLQKLPSLVAIPKVEDENLLTHRQQLLMASADLRKRKALVSIVDLGGEKYDSSARLQFRDEKEKVTIAVRKLQEVSSSIRFKLCTQIPQVVI